MYLITGGAGFIGSGLAAELVRRGERVRILDDFSSGSWENLTGLADEIEVVEGDLRDESAVRRAVRGIHGIYHQAALRSVARSVDDPLATHEVNLTGTLRLLIAARDAGVRRVVAASSSSVYGASETLPRREEQELLPVSPYAVSKLAGEHYCRVFTHLHGLETVRLRYFNVFGPRQDPRSQYAAVVPRFIRAALDATPPVIHGDGLQSRDFTYVDDVVQANLRAMDADAAVGEAFNIACGVRHSVRDVLHAIGRILSRPLAPVHMQPRSGDIRHSVADVSKARRLLGFATAVDFDDGIARTIEYFRRKGAARCARSV